MCLASSYTGLEEVVVGEKYPPLTEDPNQDGRSRVSGDRRRNCQKLFPCLVISLQVKLNGNSVRLKKK